RGYGAHAPRDRVPAVLVAAVVGDEDGPVAVAERAPSDVIAAGRPGHPGRPPRGPRDPVPAQGGREAPAAEVRRGPAPALAGHPRPSVDRPHPAPGRIGLPSGADVGPPDVADLGLVVPGPVPIELARVGGHVVGEGAGMV